MDSGTTGTQSDVLEPLDNWDGKSLTPQFTSTVQQITQVLRNHPELRRSIESAMNHRMTQAASAGGGGPGRERAPLGYQGGENTT